MYIWENQIVDQSAKKATERPEVGYVLRLSNKQISDKIYQHERDNNNIKIRINAEKSLSLWWYINVTDG